MTAVSARAHAVLKGSDGLYHMWAAEMTEHCGIGTWQQNSRVVHATSESPGALCIGWGGSVAVCLWSFLACSTHTCGIDMWRAIFFFLTAPIYMVNRYLYLYIGTYVGGSYKRKDVTWEVFSHEPEVVPAPGGTYVMYFTADLRSEHGLCNWCVPHIKMQSTATAFISCLVRHMQNETALLRQPPWHMQLSSRTWALRRIHWHRRLCTYRRADGGTAAKRSRLQLIHVIYDGPER
eukprot:SAG11_NODE_2455_length_3343_cov_2.469482_2_plen_235_part_00